MPLVDYSSDSSSDAYGKTVKRKRSISPEQRNGSRLPPLPSSFRDLYATTVRTSIVDDPTLHGGRQRVTPHIAGKWPSHVYTEWYPSKTEAELLENLIERYNDLLASKKAIRGIDQNPVKLYSLLRSDLGATAPLHISLSRSLSLNTDERDTFEAELRTNVRVSGVGSFHLSANSYKWVPNYTRSRWFLILNLNRPDNDGLNRLLAACNKTATAHSYPGLYTGTTVTGPNTKGLEAPPAPGEDVDEALDIDSATLESGSRDCTGPLGNKLDPFHISIGWTLSDPARWLSTPIKEETTTSAELKMLRILVTAVKAKIGNTIHHISLENDRGEVDKRSGRRWVGA